ncbi:MAG: hypothetical protein R3B98_08330 [Hyphomonas sp.]|nr:hypothetical protein [Hyphomonas sp.]MCB9972689.1 hypothetical protein [Hyphomonas sp.]MCC0017548.1 hypothetical protein [Rhodobiaceae bacterium]
MILRRITSAFRRQDWFTVFIETLIVVLGVFLGLQVNNWNAARQRHAAAQQYEQRLLEDLRQDSGNYFFLRDYYRGALKAAEKTYDGLTGKTDLTDADLLVAAYRASQYNWAERHRATFDELVASGNLELIGDTDFRTRVSSYYAMDLLASVSQASLNSEYRRAFRMLMPPDLQSALGEQCGDREVGPGVYTIDYPCTLDWPASDVAAQAAALKADQDILPLLRLRIANLTARDFEFDSNFTYYGMADFLPKQPEAAP